jgi:THO complex subunit 1
MVDTVLSRDRNWVRWKALGCPPIEEKPVTLEQTKDAESNAQKFTANKRLRATPLGSLNLQFLSRDYDTRVALLKDPERSSLPPIDSFLKGIANDELDIEMAMTDEDKDLLTSLKASKMWRALRIASKSKLNLFEKIEDGKNLGILSDIKPEIPEIQVENEENGVADEPVVAEQEEASA